MTYQSLGTCLRMKHLSTQKHKYSKQCYLQHSKRGNNPNVHKLEHYLAIKSNKVPMHATKRMNLETNAVKDASHKRSPIVRFYVYELSRIGKSMESESRLGLLEAGRSGGRK